MPYRIAGIDVHKKMLAVVVSDVEVDSEYQFERRMFGSDPEQLRSLAAWLLEQEVEEVVMESTAQYWKPVWEALERYPEYRRDRHHSAGRVRDPTIRLYVHLQLEPGVLDIYCSSDRAGIFRDRDFLHRLYRRLPLHARQQSASWLD